VLVVWFLCVRMCVWNWPVQYDDSNKTLLLPCRCDDLKKQFVWVCVTMCDMSRVCWHLTGVYAWLESMRARNVCPQLQCEAPSLCCVSAYVCVSLVVHVFLFVCAHLYGIFVPSGPLLLKTHQHCHINTTHINTTHINIVTSTQHTSTQHTSTLSHQHNTHQHNTHQHCHMYRACIWRRHGPNFLGRYRVW